MTHAELAALTSRKPGKTFEEMPVAIGASLSDLASSDNGEDEHDKETEQGKLSEDDEPGWVMGTITKIIQQRMDRFRQKEMRFDELTQLGWEDAADNFRVRVKKYGASKLRVPAVVQLETNDDAMPNSPTTFAEHMQSLDIVPGISEETSRPRSSHSRLGSVKLQSKSSIPSGEPSAEADLSPLLKAKRVELVIFYPCIWPPADYHIDIGFQRRDADGSCVCGRIDIETVIFDV
jgi:hypothetical protein